MMAATAAISIVVSLEAMPAEAKHSMERGVHENAPAWGTIMLRSGKYLTPRVLLSISVGLVGLLAACRSQPIQEPREPVASASPPASLQSTAESPAERAIRAAEAVITAKPRVGASYVALAAAYMQKARESGDASYYGRAEAAVREALALEPYAVDALRTLAWVQTGKHEFREALATAEQLLTRQPDDPLVHALLGDAAIELGEYARAEEAFQKMLDLRPGLASYSRAAYLLELYGKSDEAIGFMERAVKAGGARDPEPLAWCLVQLGHLHFNQGRLGKAETAYNNALAVFPRYYQAVAALGRVRGAQQRYAEAIVLYQQASAVVPAPDLLAALGDILMVAGKANEAEQQYALVEYIEQVNAMNQKTYNRQLALFYADHDRKLDEAVTLAETELTQRHDIYSFDVLAWVYYKKGRFAAAQKMMVQAMRFETQDARLMFHAGMIAQGLGDADAAKEYLRRALEINPYFSLRDAETARATLAALEQQVVAQGERHVP
jgi:tetratricopeptide (TPR) repeat protein